MTTFEGMIAYINKPLTCVAYGSNTQMLVFPLPLHWFSTDFAYDAPTKGPGLLERDCLRCLQGAGSGADRGPVMDSAIMDLPVRNSW